ncbi:nucleotide-binding protein [Microbacterium sorbitolivorans]|uniref:RNase adapter RapZ n=1 Tax=Microbacterium sorbitolivorans TaxID=1867410 RepID=A0A367Y662_9MICO|nr:RNase adapter RapZ [Microbacterium sorbitolivorans]RCK61354.1 RNase adapter RapZ [Microbacterium sorbitolivorans]GGF32980.1 nucleotide-binding protein [Microbacterium sorbitolivorans]
MSGTVQTQGEVLIVTGMSGAGRSTAADALEDHGWYVVDNLPPQMLRPLLELAGRIDGKLPRIAAVVDVRGGEMFADLAQIVHQLREANNLRIVFLDASDDALVRRFEQVRRPHPLQADGTLLDGIHEERRLVQAIRDRSDVTIDTSDLNVHQLANRISDLVLEEGAPRHRTTILSFGFKYGLPVDADLVADMRFLPNPFWIDELRSLSGEDQAVSDYVLAQDGAEEFLDAYVAALRPILAGYQRENKSHSMIAIGCTGGKHRSVAMALALGERLAAESDLRVRVRHRDLGRE